MDRLKELVDKIYNDLQKSDWINEYPEFKDKNVIAEIIQDMAIEIMPNYVGKGKLDEFVTESDKSYNEKTFKKYIKNYSSFLDDVELEFYSDMLVWLTEN